MAVRLDTNRILRPRTDGSTELVDDGRLIVPAAGLQVGNDVRVYRDAAGNIVFDDLVGYNDRALQQLFPKRLYRLNQTSDFNGISDINWTGGAIAGGTSSLATSDYNTHPGVFTQKAVGAPAGSGYTYVFPPSGGRIATFQGGNIVKGVHQILTANQSMYLGQGDAATVAALANGLYFDIVGIVATAHTRSNTTGHQTDSAPYNLTLNTWYRFEVDFGLDLVAHFRIYDCIGPTLVFSEDIAADIPTAAYFGGYSTVSTVGGNANLVNTDFLSLEILKDIVR
jgi:hypothetical protein